MDAAHLHLLLNHVPVLGAVFGFLLLAYAEVRASQDVCRAGLWTLGLVGVTAVAVYLTGEPAEELVEGLPGFSHDALERHEAIALWATVAAAAVGLLSFVTLRVYRARRVPGRFRAVLLIVTLVLAGVMGWVANSGGQVRHEEIRGPAPAAEERAGESGGEAEGDGLGRAAAAPGTEDGRQAVAVPEGARMTILAEMRQMLEALDGVLRAAAGSDRTAMKEAALSGGTRIAVDMDPTVARSLPEAFVRLGSSTHRDFDDLAAAVGRGVPRDSVLSRLSSLTAKCVSCHATYRLVRPGEVADTE